MEGKSPRGKCPGGKRQGVMAGGGGVLNCGGISPRILYLYSHKVILYSLLQLS